MFERNVEVEPQGINVTFASAIIEARKILSELNAVLSQTQENIIGEHSKEEVAKEPKCLLDEAQSITGLAYDCLLKAKRIKDALF